MKLKSLWFLGFALGVLSCTPEKKALEVQGPEASKPTIALVVKTLTNPFFIEMERGARQAEKELNFTLTVKSAAQETSIDQQVAIIEQLIADQVRAIVIAPGSSTELIPVLKKAQTAGITLVNIDNQLDPQASQAAGLKTVPFISVDNVQGAYLSAKRLFQEARGPGKVLVLEGIREAANANQRKTGALKALQEFPQITLAASETAHWKIDEALEVTRRVFKAQPDISLIFAANDMMAFGALEYLKESGRKGVAVAGYDALEDAVKAVKAGDMVATVDQQAKLQGFMGCKTALDLLGGAQVPPVVLVDVQLITKENP